MFVDADEIRFHRVDYHLMMAEALGIHIEVRTPRLFLTDEEMEATAEVLKKNGLHPNEPFVVMHSGARRWYKSWTLEYFSELGENVARELYVPVVLARGISDAQAEEKIQRGMTAPCIKVAAQLNVRELACLMKMAAFCIVNDTAPMHLAAVVGTPTAAIFSLTDPKHWAPRDPQQ
jgi:ADP-heptose:LPS heptosyltransferase